MMPAYLGDAKFWGLLLRFDEDLATDVQGRGCPYCGAQLHAARYPRKPRGIARTLLGQEKEKGQEQKEESENGNAYAYRLSFCCARRGCRRRTTPPSVRFLGQRVYLGALVVLVSALSQGLTVKALSRLCQQLSVSERTVRRWWQWWREVFPSLPWWSEAQARFMPPVDIGRLPVSLLERFQAAEPGAQLLAVLSFLAPLSIGAAQAC